MAANFFDQFDEKPAEKNFFDQLDEPAPETKTRGGG